MGPRKGGEEEGKKYFCSLLPSSCLCSNVTPPTTSPKLLGRVPCPSRRPWEKPNPSRALHLSLKILGLGLLWQRFP